MVVLRVCKCYSTPHNDPPIQLTFPFQPLVGTHGPGENVQAILMQEDIPFDPDDIGEPMQGEKSECTTTAPLVNNASTAWQSLPRAITQADVLIIDVNASSTRTSVICDHVREEGTHIIDLTGEESELTETAGCADQFDDFMDNLDDKEFCTSFANFDEDDDEDYQPSEGKEKKEESISGSDEEDWEDEGVDYVKTVAEMAEEANTSDLFDPKVLGK